MPDGPPGRRHRRNPKRLVWLCAAALLGCAAPYLIFGWEIPQPLPMIDYAPGVALYRDRDYATSTESPLLRGAKVILIRRHRHEPIRLVTESPMVVYRMLSRANDNSVFADHRDMAVPVRVEGLSCRMDRLVSRSYPAGAHDLESGGPVAASPLLVRTAGPLRAEEGRSVFRLVCRAFGIGT